MNRVLIVDDDPSFLTAFEDLLSYVGFHVISAVTGDQAISVLSQQSADVALLDLRLGGENGFDLLPRLKQACPEMAVIMISSLATSENREIAIRLGAIDFLSKSIDPSHLVNILANPVQSP